jgi:hypothetical protein
VHGTIVVSLNEFRTVNKSVCIKIDLNQSFKINK